MHLEAGGRHGGVVHRGDGEPHHHRAHGLPPDETAGDVAPQGEGQPHGDKRNHNRDHHGERHQRRPIMGAGGQTHGGHAGVMHGRNPESHDDAAGNGLPQADLRAAHHPERHRRGKYRGHQGKRDRRNIVEHRNRQVEREHSDVMHRPDTDAHRDCAARQPATRRLPARRGGYPPPEVEGRVRGGSRDQYREDDQRGVVRSRKMIHAHSIAHGRSG